MLAEQRRRYQTGNQTLATENGPSALTERDIPVVTWRQTALAIDLPVGKRDRHDRIAPDQRRLQQGGMKMQQTAAICRRTFRKYRDMTTTAKQLTNFLIDDLCVTAAASAQEDGVVFRRQPANDRPVPDLFLRDEG